MPEIQIILVYLTLGFCASQTVKEAPSSVSGTFTLLKVDSPYVASQGIVIEEAGRLHIEAGVEVRFAPGTGLDVHGDLIVNGDVNDPINLTLWDDGVITNDVDNTELRLTDMDRDDSGILQVNSSGNWVTLCDNRLNDPSRYEAAIKSYAKVCMYKTINLVSSG